MTIKKSLALILFPIFLMSCSHLNQSCLQINWYEIGRQDSKKGIEREEALNNRRKTCSIKKDSNYAQAYNNGFDAGLSEYCNFRTAYIYGLSQKKQEANICPPSLRDTFEKGYQAGIRMSQIQEMESNMKRRIGSIEQKYQTIVEKKSAKSVEVETIKDDQDSKNEVAEKKTSKTPKVSKSKNKSSKDKKK